MNPNKLIRLALWLSRYKYSTITVDRNIGSGEIMLVIGKKPRGY